MEYSSAFPTVTAAVVRADRTISSTDTATADSYDPLNLIFIVAFAVFIAALAQRLTRRGGRRK